MTVTAHRTVRSRRPLIGLCLMMLLLLGNAMGDIPNYAASPLCAMEISTSKAQFRTDEQIQLNMWLKVNDIPALPEIESARLELEIQPPFGTFITLRTQEDIGLRKGAEWEQALLTLPVDSEPFRNLGDYQAHATLFSSDQDVLCEAYTSFAIRSIFGQVATTRTLVVTSRRTDLTEPFVSRLSTWLEAAYRTRVQVIYQEGILQSYQSGDFRDFDVIIYYGTDFAQTPPAAFINDLADGDGMTNKTVVWLGYHLDQLGDALTRYGLSYGDVTTGNPPASMGYADTGGTFTLLNQDRITVNIVDSGLAQPRASVADRPIIASARRADQPEGDPSLYFVGFHPTAFLTPGGAHLVFLDLMSEVYGIQRGRTALVRLEDIDAREDPDQLLRITRYLRSEGVPFTLALIPVFRDGQGTEIRISRDGDFRRLVKSVLLDGGELVLHGSSHQYDGETGIDYEFWDEATNTPIGGAEYAESRVADALMEAEFSGLQPFVVGWETPHYRAGPDQYAVFEEHFPLMYEDPHWSHQLNHVPYPVVTQNSVYMPTNLGYVRGDAVETEIAAMLNRAQTLSGLQYGALASLYYHPQLDLEGLQRLVSGLKAQGWTFRAVSAVANTGP